MSKIPESPFERASRMLQEQQAAEAAIPQIEDELLTGGSEQPQTWNFSLPGQPLPHIEHHDGLTVLDRYALTVMQYVLRWPNDVRPDPKDIVGYCFEVASMAVGMRAAIIDQARRIREEQAIEPAGDDAEGPAEDSVEPLPG